jgi:hypothetical protein
MNKVRFRSNHIFTAVRVRRVYADSLYGTAYGASEQVCSLHERFRPSTHPYAHLRTGGLHSTEGLNRPSSISPIPHPRLPSPPGQNLSSPRTHRNSANPLKPNQIKHSKTWHSYPAQLATLEVEPKSKLHRQQPLQLSLLAPNSNRKKIIRVTRLE